jgi:quercetin dioxygenase-like cupin family protein
MNIEKDIIFKQEHPGVLSIQKRDGIMQFAVALHKGQLLPNHTTHHPALLMVLKGSVIFRTRDSIHTLYPLDVFQIPVNVQHEIEGVGNENIFMVTKAT